MLEDAMTQDVSSHEIVAAARALAPLIRECRNKMESQRHLSEAVVQGLADAGIFRAYYPRSLGGLEVDPLTFMEMVEELSRVDPSTGWCAMIAGDSGYFGSRLNKGVALDLFGQPPDLRGCGTVIPRGEAHIVRGGVRISGHFTFASGIKYSNWLLSNCKVFDPKGPRTTPQGMPETMMAFVPVQQAQVLDSWVVAGMCATGSHDFVVSDVFVPEERTFAPSSQPDHPGPLFHPRPMMVFLLAPCAACLLGIARGALDVFLGSVVSLSSNMSPMPLRDRSAVQLAVGQAEAMIGSARAYLFDSVSKVWGAVCDGETDLSRVITHARLAITHGMRESARAVDLLYEAAGTTAVYRSHPIERYYQDIHVAAKHWGGYASNFEMAGQSLMGLKPAGPGW
jgi:indole-3-acetate monooxygenase